MRYWPLIILMSLSACAHKADLKSPSQIASEKKKNEARAARTAARNAKDKAKAQDATAPAQPQDSQEVTVP